MKREATPEEHEQIVRALMSGDRIQAISLYIASTECGLTRAQDYVRALSAELRASHPDKFSDRPGKRKALAIFGR